jgi:geranylgeranyl diphosphate synthase type II
LTNVREASRALGAQMDVRSYLRERKDEVDEALKTCMPPQDQYPTLLHQGMHYSLFAGGKRIRPILHLATVEATGGDYKVCMPFACALELIHTYSLIHDDLPAMDDDDLLDPVGWSGGRPWISRPRGRM